MGTLQRIGLLLAIGIGACLLWTYRSQAVDSSANSLYRSATDAVETSDGDSPLVSVENGSETEFPSKARVAVELDAGRAEAGGPDPDPEPERRWILSFGIASNLSAEPSELRVDEPDGSQHSAQLDGLSGRYRTDLMGTRAELERGELVLSSGRGAVARRSVIQLGTENAPDAAGVLRLEEATWDLESAIIDAGVVALVEPPLLGRLILEPEGTGGAGFEITCDGASRALKTRVSFSWGDAAAELATFLPATEWSASFLHGAAMKSAPDWSESAPSGSDIVVHLTDARGVRVALDGRLMKGIAMVAFLRLPAPSEPYLTQAALEDRCRRQGTHCITVGGSGGVRGIVHLHQLGQQFLDRGSYMAEVWGVEGPDGSLRLLASKPVHVRDGFVDVVID